MPSDDLSASGITTIDHVGIAVPDLDAAIAWYAENLGLVATHQEVNEEQGVREAMLHAPGDDAGPAPAAAPPGPRRRRARGASPRAPPAPR